MSLINEALKKARQAELSGSPKETVRTTTPAGPLPEYRAPVTREDPKQKQLLILVVAGSAFIAVISLAIVLLVFLGRRGSPQPILVATPAVATQPVTQPAAQPGVVSTAPDLKAASTQPNASPSVMPAAQTAAVDVKAPEVQAPLSSTQTSVQASPASATPPVLVPVAEKAPVPVVAADPPKLKLQGIALNNGKIEAMINGETVIDGDEIEGVTVVKVERRRVLMKFQDKEYYLHLR